MTRASGPLAALAAMALAVPAGATSPDRIVFAGTRGGEGTVELYTVSARGGRTYPITADSADDFGPRWSPEARRIAFYSNRDSADPDQLRFDVFVLDDGIHPVAAGPADDREPAWSPNGARLVFDSDRSGNYELYSVRPDGTGLRRLTRTRGDESVPDWSPDGRRIAFSLGGRIWVMSADGSRRRALTRAAGGVDWAPAWSPDGRWLAFESNRAMASQRHPTNEIWIVRADGNGLRRLTHNRANDNHPSWSPDGRRLVFARHGAGLSQLYVMRPDGGGVRRVTTGAGVAALQPDW